MRVLLFAASLLAILAGAVIALPGAPKPMPLAEPLQDLEPFVGKTWRGTFADGSVDVSRWERALNGNAVRILHSLNDGAYGGETIIMFDQASNSLKGWYFSTGGFQTVSTITLGEGRWESHETVTGEADGVTEVRGVATLLPDGRMESRSEYLKDGVWVEGHGAIYAEAPDAELVWR